MSQILLLCEYPTLNGGERSMLATLDGARRAGFRFVAAAPQEGPLADRLRDRGIEVEPFRIADASGRRWPQTDLRDRLAAILARRRPDLVHANSLAMGRLAGPVAAAAGVPSIAHLRDIVGLSARAADDLNEHSRLLAVSAATRDFHVAQGLERGRVHVLHNGVDLEEFHPRPATGYLHRELGLAAGSRLVATIGQIGLRKGQDVLARAAADVAARIADVHFLLIGERNSSKAESRSFEAALHEAARSLGGRLHFLGRRDDVAALMNEVSLLVHPARQEPLGRVLLEAAASGLAVVATEVGGTAEIFPSDSNAARLVPPDDPAALSAAIVELLEDDAARKRIAAAARRRAEEAFDARHAADRLVAHYREVVALGDTR